MSQVFCFSPGEYRIRPALMTWERDACSALRRTVFCDEQQLFEDDGDFLDATAQHISVLTCLLGEPEQVVGTVRIDERKPGIWFGSRLAVQRDYRCGFSLGKHLIRHAVTVARAQGASAFYAYVQHQNVPLFQRMHWLAMESLELHGQPHQLMRADLDFYPAAKYREITLYLPSRVQRIQPLPLLEAA